jgi:ATP-dependent helicase HepA
MLKAGRAMARDRSRPVIEAARREAGQAMDATADRIAALSRVNPAIRDGDVDAARRERDAVLSAVSAARLRLDAIRLIVKGKGF